MHMWVFQVGAPNVTGEEKFFGPDPAEDRTRDPPHKNQTLYRVAIKAGLYRKTVQVCYIPIPCDTYLNILVSLEHLVLLVTSIFVTKP